MKKRIIVCMYMLALVCTHSSRAESPEIVSDYSALCDVSSADGSFFDEDDGPEPVIPAMAPMSNVQRYACIAAMKVWIIWRTASRYMAQVNHYLEENLYAKIRVLL